MKSKLTRKILKTFGVALISSALFLSSCKNAADAAMSNSEMIISYANEQAEKAYHAYLNQGGTMTYEEWLQSIKGEDGKTPYIGNNGHWWVGDKDTGVVAAGKDGVSITVVAKIGTEGNVDTYRIFFSDNTYFDFTIKNGTDGKDGKDGKDGTDGKDGIDGKDGASVLFGYGIPSSDKGKNGDSYIDLDSWNYYVKAGDNWVKQGNLHGEAGPQGEQGETGKSAYELAVENGYQGTLQEWLESLLSR